MGDDSREIVVWVPPHMRGDVAEAEKAKEDALRKARQAEADARLAVARTKELNAKIQETGAELVLDQLKKYLKLANHADFANSTGPLDPAIILKLAEFVAKYHRLDTGQATENVAHTIGPSVDFGKLTQEERDTWKRLALKGGGTGE